MKDVYLFASHSVIQYLYWWEKAKKYYKNEIKKEYLIGYIVMTEFCLDSNYIFIGVH